MPESNALKDSTWHRAREDTERFRQSLKFFLGLEIACAAMLGLIGGYVGFYLTPNHASPQAVYLYPAIGATAGLVFGVVVVYITILFWNWFRAPYRQRNELRLALKQHAIPTLDQQVASDLKRLQRELVDGLEDYLLLVRESDKEAMHTLYIHGLVTKKQRSVYMSGINYPEYYWTLTDKGKQEVLRLSEKAK